MGHRIATLLTVLSVLTLHSISFASGEHDHQHGTPNDVAHPMLGAAHEALEAYIASSTTGDAGLVGFQVGHDLDEAEVDLFVLTAPEQIAKDTYHCHYEANSQAHCHAEGITETQAYSPSSLNYTHEDLLTASSEALAVFKNKVADLSTLNSLKIWQVSGDLRLVLTYADSASATAESYMMCHYHGSHIDCHRKRDRGGLEPFLN